MIKKRSNIEKFRITTQLIVFMVVCLSFILYRLYIKGLIDYKLFNIHSLTPFGGLSMMYDWLTDKDYLLNYSSLAFLLAAAIMILALLGTRFFCGWICPFGALNDYVGRLGQKILKRNHELPSRIDTGLRYFKYFVLLFIIASKIFVGSCMLTKFDPWIAFANLPGLPGTFEELPFAFLVLLLVVAGAFLIKRFFCRYLCPLGALQGVLVGTGIIRLIRQREVTTTCSKCSHCHFQCPVNFQLGCKEIIDSPECISCLRCVGGSCPRGVVPFELTFLKRSIKTSVYLLGTLILFFGIYIGVGFSEIRGGTDSSAVGSLPFNNYRDGIYEGTGFGFAPGLKVQVEVTNGLITSIKVLEHAETSGYYEDTFIQMSGRIINSQSTEVDTVSGATYTSNGFLEAVEDALGKANP